MVSLPWTIFSCSLQFMGYSEMYGQNSLLQKVRHNVLHHLASRNLKEKNISTKKRECIYLNLPKDEIHLILDIGLRTAEPGNLLFLFEGLGEKGNFFSLSTTKCSKPLPKEAEWDCLKCARTTATEMGFSGRWVKRKIQTTCWSLVASVTVQEVEAHEDNACQSTWAGSNMVSFINLVVSASINPTEYQSCAKQNFGKPLQRSVEYSAVLCSNA